MNNSLNELQMDNFAHVILTNGEVKVPWKWERKDVMIIQAIYEAMKTGNRVEISSYTLSETLY